MSSEHVEVLRDLSEVCRAAIKAGDWKVDGACDPDSLLRHADAAIASLSAPQPPAEANEDEVQRVARAIARVIGHGMTEKCEAHARAAIAAMGAPPAEAQPVAVPTVIVQQGTRVALVEGKPGYERIRCYWELPEGAELFLRPPPSAPVGVEAIAAEIRASLGRGATVCTRRRWAIELEALAQQPAADDSEQFQRGWQAGMLAGRDSVQPAADNRICSVCDGGPGNDGPCLCGERRWEQPAAVDEADAQDAEIEALRAEVELARKARRLQRDHFGDGMSLHLTMMGWAREYDALRDHDQEVGNG